jgi:hypothetical protein
MTNANKTGSLPMDNTEMAFMKATRVMMMKKRSTKSLGVRLPFESRDELMIAESRWFYSRASCCCSSLGALLEQSLICHQVYLTMECIAKVLRAGRMDGVGDEDPTKRTVQVVDCQLPHSWQHAGAPLNQAALAKRAGGATRV